tara:strand:+ start:161 stop:502 length:342 start_codon:yes stop_codon:yes gene_type:complete
MYKTWFHKLKNASNNPKSVNLASKALIAGEGYARETQGISFSADQIDPIDKGIGNDAKLNSNNNNNDGGKTIDAQIADIQALLESETDESKIEELQKQLEELQKQKEEGNSEQ